MSYAPFPLVWGFFGSGGGGGGGGPAFGVIQTDFGTYPTASSTTDVLTFVSADPTKYYFTGTALTDTVTLTVNGLMPTSGTTGQVLKKLSATDYDAAWATLTKSDVGLGNVDNVSLIEQDLAQKEPTGFPNRTDSTISFNAGTRVFSISPATTSFDVWIKGTKYTKSSTETITISTTAGNHYIYYDSTGSLAETTTFSVNLFIDNAMVSILYWNSDNNTSPYFADERHGMQMDGASQVYLHTVFGTRYLTGLALQSFDPDNNTPTNASAQFTSDSGTIRDEDILHTLASQTQIPILYKSGTLWRKKAADAYPIIYNGTAGYTGTRVPYNQLVAGSWQLTEVTNGNYVMVHLFATNDINNGVVGVMGTNEYSNAPQARAAADTEINSLSDLPFAEFTAIGTVIFQTQTSYTNTPKARVVSSNPSIGEVYIDFRGEQLYTPSGVATSHSLLSNLSSDDHTQYHNDARGDLRYLQLAGGTLTGAVTSTSTLAATNLSGTNTGDETTASIQTKLGVASTSTSGYLTFTDWNTFNGKQNTITGAASTITTTDLTANRVLVSDGAGKVADSSVTTTTLGYLDATSSIQTQLNGKEPTLTKGNLTEATSSVLTITGGTGAVIGSGTTVQVKQANATQAGYVSSDDWTFFDNKMTGYEMDYSVRVAMGSSTLSGINGMTSATSGTIALANFSGASTIGKIPHVTINTTSTAGSTCGFRTGTSYFCVGGGFIISTIFQVSDAATVANARHFFGANTSSSATAINGSTNNNPLMNSLTNFFAFASDAGAGDTNFCIYHNGNTAGSTTRVSLGASFPVGNTGEIYQVTFYNHPATLDIYYRVTALVANVTSSGKITGTSSNLPTTTQLYMHNERFNAGTGSVVKFEAGSIFIYSFG